MRLWIYLAVGLVGYTVLAALTAAPGLYEDGETDCPTDDGTEMAAPGN